MPTTPTKESLADKLSYISSHSCEATEGKGDSDQRLYSRNDVTVSPKNRQQQTHVIRENKDLQMLQALNSIILELNKSLTEINSKGEVYDSLHDDFYSSTIQVMKKWTFRAKWVGSVSDLSSQQVIRIQALVRTAGYVYHMQIQKPENPLIFGTDAPHLQKILMELRSATCILVDLLPKLDIKDLFSKSEIPKTFDLHLPTKGGYKLSLLRMGLTLLDIHESVKGMTVSVEDGTLSID